MESCRLSGRRPRPLDRIPGFARRVPPIRGNPMMMAMSGVPHFPNEAQLLAEFGFVRRLALSLVRDPHLADDLITDRDRTLADTLQEDAHTHTIDEFAVGRK